MAKRALDARKRGESLEEVFAEQKEAGLQLQCSSIEADQSTQELKQAEKPRKPVVGDVQSGDLAGDNNTNNPKSIHEATTDGTERPRSGISAGV